jgi:hypothetical protein
VRVVKKEAPADLEAVIVLGPGLIGDSSCPDKMISRPDIGYGNSFLRSRRISMVDVTDQPPTEVLTDLAQLSSALDEDLPAKALDRNLLIATWNIRAFGDLTDKWESEEEDSPKRDLHSLLCIAEIVSRFDVVAVQEAKDNLKALRHMLKILGPNWGLSLTDVTEGAPGNAERMAFLFDTRRVQLSVRSLFLKSNLKLSSQTPSSDSSPVHHMP